MNIELDALLCERYPQIFEDRHTNITTSCMAFGFLCGDGWFKLIDSLCAQLQVLSEKEDSMQVVATQVKEKFGGLCFYVRSATDEQYDLIDFMEQASEHICEACGLPGQTAVNKRLFHDALPHTHARRRNYKSGVFSVLRRQKIREVMESIH